MLWDIRINEIRLKNLGCYSIEKIGIIVLSQAWLT
jgi:hypothetical protein